MSANVLRHGAHRTWERGHKSVKSVRLRVEALEARDVPAGPYGLNIPSGHPRLWFTPDRLTQAQQWYANHPFTPATDDAWGNALAYKLTGNATYGTRAVNILMDFTVPQGQLDGVQSDSYRWADWVPLVFDWCYDKMTPTQVSTFTARYNGYTDTLRQKSWGGDGFEANNYYWGIWRNELDWGIATYGDNLMADTFLQDALVTRWQNGFLPYAAGPGAGGVPQEGSAYGEAMLQYPVVPLVTANLLGRNLLSETNFYTEAAYNLLYSTSTGPVNDGTSSYYQWFAFDDDDNRFPSADSYYLTDFMTAMAGETAGTPLAGYIRQWMNNVGAGTADKYIQAVDTGGAARPLSELPTDYYAPGPGFFYGKSDWSANAMSLLLQMGSLNGVGHAHQDSGTFQILRGGQWVTKETTGYASQIVGFDGSGTVGVADPLAHNGVVVNGQGQVRAWTEGDAQVTRMESQPEYVFASNNLTPVFRSTQSSLDNPAVQSVVRDYVYVRSLDAFVVLDRMASNAVSDKKTFLLHFPNNPTVSGNTVLGTIGNQALKLTTLTPAGQAAPTFKIVNERPASPDPETDYHYRLEETTSGQTQSYLINVLQARTATAADLTATLAEDANSFTITLRDSNGRTAVIKFAKGMTSTGGAFGFATSGTPTLTPLTTTVEPIRVTTDGVTWGAGASLQVTAPTAATAGTSFSVTVKALDADGIVNSGYTGTVHFTSSDGQAILPANYTFTAADAGIHAFTVTLKTAGNQTVRAADTANSALLGSAAVTVSAAAASTVTLSGYPSTTTVGVSHTFTVKLTDAYGNPATGYRGTVHFSSSDTAAGLPANYAFTAGDAGTHNFSATFNTVGTQSLTTTDTSAAGLTGSQSGIVVNAGGDTTPPTITNTNPASGATGVPFSVIVKATFSEAVQANTILFVLKDSANTNVPGTVSYDSSTRTASFQPTAALSPTMTYTATVSGAKDAAGNTMSSVSWVFTTQDVAPSPSLGFDFDTASSTTAAGYTGVKLATYTPAAKFGWESITGMGAINRPILNALNRDFHYGRDGTFLVDVADGTYDVTIRIGDASARRDRVWVWAEGSLLASEVATAANQFLQVRGRVTVADGQFTLRLADLGGTSPCFAIDGLNLARVDPASQSIWPPEQLPVIAGASNTAATELGVRFQPTADGYIAGIRFYKGAANTGTHTGSLWAADGTRLATATFTSESATGWQEVRFAAPVAVSANTTYVASYFAPRGRYAVDLNYFALSGISAGNLNVPSTRDGGGGVFGKGAGFPTLTRNSNFWVDVVFTQDTTPPTVTSVTPADQATGISTGATINVKFSEAMKVSSLTTNTILLKTTTGATVPGSMSYDPATLTATLIPASALAAGTTYSVLVKGGAAGAAVQDQSGNPLAADFTSTFTTAAGSSGLVAAFGFNEGAGTTVGSTVGGLTGTISGATWTSGGRFGNALSFNGTSSIVTVADSNALDLTTGMTLEAWVNPSSVGTWETVLMKERTNGLAYGMYGSTNAGVPAGYINTGGSDVAAAGPSSLATGTWAHLAVTYDGSNLRLFVNGALARTTANTGSLVTSNGNLSIGGNSVWGEYFNGLIDEVRVYNRSLSQSEIQSDMNSGI